jgi:hypothetical protein
MAFRVHWCFVILSLVSCKQKEVVPLMNAFEIDGRRFLTPFCFMKDYGIEGANRTYRLYEVAFVDIGFDNEPFVGDNNNHQAVVFIVDSPSLDELAEGEYHFHEGTSQTFCNTTWGPLECSGAVSGYDLLMDPVDRIVYKYYNDGKVTITKSGTNIYSFTYTSSYPEGKNLIGNWEGTPEIQDLRDIGCYTD